MAKRHHSSKHHGPKHHQAHLSEHNLDGHYEGHAHKMATEASDGDMIPSGAGHFANLPQEVVFRGYPDGHAHMPEHLDDSIRGIDHQLSEDDGKKHQHMHPKKV